MNKLIHLILGGIGGTLARYFLAGAVYQLTGTNFPYGTLIVNLLGCFLIGFLVSLSENKFLLTPETRLLLIVGFCGAFTTFSTFILETSNLIKDGENLKALANVLGSVIIGFVVFRWGVILANNL